MKKIIFDLDDTLYSSKNLRDKREEKIIEFLGEKAFPYFELKKNGKGTIESFKLLGFSREEFFQVINSVPINIQRDDLLVQILGKLKEKYELIVLSNSSRESVHKVLKELGVFYLFNRIYAGEDFLNEKPHEECFFMVEKNDICVGNSYRKDLDIPRRKGALTVLIGKKSPADFNIGNIYDIEEVIYRVSTA